MHLHHPANTSKVLKWSLIATFAYIVVTAVAGVRAHSLALISEAGHNLSDFLALLLSLVALYFQTRPPSSTKTFGYQRSGVLAAFVNAIMLVGLAIYIFYEAVHRLYAPVAVQASVMIYVAAAGVVMNGLIALALYKNSHDLNIRSAFLHEIGDTLSTAAVIVGGWIILNTGQYWIDSVLSFGIGALILWSAVGIIRETLNILLEGTPRGMSLTKVADEIARTEGVLDVHDLHVWSLGAETHALSCHIRIADIPPSASERILRDVNDRLARLFHINHTTIQFEHVVCDIAHGCVIPVADHPHSHTH
ncbi:MAG: cation diffusion facilitator family transporter [Acidobacteriales bacterium]|nr:cation diffusion facilitator family transporter [Terriglobales bacterium]